MTFTLHQGDCIEVMRRLPDHSVDSVVTDPPYGIRFMGKAWDGADIDKRHGQRQSWASQDPSATVNGAHKSVAAEAGKYNLSPASMLAFQEFSREWAIEAMRVLKPGGYLLSFSSPRTYHRMVCGVEDAGFEIRDCIQWIFGSGFPKSHNLDGEREGWGTALKPAHEPIVLARKPLQIGYTVAANVLAHGTGAIHIDACRIESEPMAPNTGKGALPRRHESEERAGSVPAQPHDLGRWPANIIHDGSPEVLAGFPDTTSGSMSANTRRAAQDEPGSVCFGTFGGNVVSRDIFASSGSAARFFYCAKASKADRNEGCEHIAEKQYSHDGRETSIDNAYQRNSSNSSNSHPTVKPTDLMAYLCRLVTPPGGIVLDPFMGSGSTGKAAVLEGFNFIGIDLSAEYLAIAKARIVHAERQGHQPSLELESA